MRRFCGWIERCKRGIAAVLVLCMTMQFLPVAGVAFAQQTDAQSEGGSAWEQGVLELFGYCAEGDYFAAGEEVSAATIFNYVYFSPEMRAYEDAETGCCSLSYAQYYAIVDRYFPVYNAEELRAWLRANATCDDAAQTIQFWYYGSGGGVEWRFCSARQTADGYCLRGVMITDTQQTGAPLYEDGWYVQAPVQLTLSSADPESYQILSYTKADYWLSGSGKDSRLYRYDAAANAFTGCYRPITVTAGEHLSIHYEGDVITNADGTWYNEATGFDWAFTAAENYVVGRVWYNDTLVRGIAGTVQPGSGAADLYAMPGVLFTVEAEHADVMIVMGMESYVDNTYLYCAGAAVELVVTPEEGYEVVSVMVGSVQAENYTEGTTYMASGMPLEPGVIRVTTRLIGTGGNPDSGDGPGTGGNPDSGDGPGTGGNPDSGDGPGTGSNPGSGGETPVPDTTAPKAVILPAQLTAAAGVPVTLSGVNSTDNVKIKSWQWSFGDGTGGSGAVVTHTYANPGTYTVRLTVTDSSNNMGVREETITVCEIAGEDASHALTELTVINGYVAGTPAIADATVSVTNEAGFETTGTTDANGVVRLVVPRGACTVSVMADGYAAAGRSVTVAPDETGIYRYTVSMLAVGVSAVDGYLTTNDVSLAEMQEVGIDTSNLENQQVTKVKLTLNFKASATTEFDFDYDVTGYFDEEGNFLGGKGWGWNFWDFLLEKDKDDDYEVPDIDRPDPIVLPEWLNKKGPGVDFGVFPISENFFLVVYGEAHWLKEMYNVELLVINNSYAESIENCTAELQLPEGLSLAAMIDRQQTEAISIGTVACKSDQQSDAAPNSTSVNWYVRGDVAGEYNLTAHVTGDFVNANGQDVTPFAYDFTTKEPIRVYAGDALKMTIRVQDTAFRGERYYVQFQLTNVSDKNLYGLSFRLTETEQYEAILMSDKSEEYWVFSQDMFKNNETYGLNAISPGETITLNLSTTAWFNKSDMEFTSSAISGVEIGYFLQNILLTTLSDSTTAIPYEVEIVKVDKPQLGEWIWDSANSSADDKVEEEIEGTAVKVIEQVLFGGIPVLKMGLKVLNYVDDNYTMKDSESVVTIQVSDGAYLTEMSNQPSGAAGSSSSAKQESTPLAYGLRRRSAGCVAVYTDGEHTISPDGTTMTVEGGASIYILRQAEGDAKVTITVPYLQDCMTDDPDDDEIRRFTYELSSGSGAEEAPSANAVEAVLEPPTDDVVPIPAEGETTVRLNYFMVTESGEMVTEAPNAQWQIESESGSTEGLSWQDGVLTVNPAAQPGRYDLVLALTDRDAKAVQTVTLTGNTEPGGGDDSGAGNLPDGGNNSGSGNLPGGDDSGSGNLPGGGDDSGSGNLPSGGTGSGTGGGTTGSAVAPATGDSVGVWWTLLFAGMAGLWVCLCCRPKRRDGSAPNPPAAR